MLTRRAWLDVIDESHVQSHLVANDRSQATGDGVLRDARDGVIADDIHDHAEVFTLNDGKLTDSRRVAKRVDDRKRVADVPVGKA